MKYFIVLLGLQVMVFFMHYPILRLIEWFVDVKFEKRLQLDIDYDDFHPFWSSNIAIFVSYTVPLIVWGLLSRCA